MNVLLVSIAFPPKRDAESLQVAKYFSALTQLGEAEIDVVTSALPTLYMPTDEGLRQYARGYRQLVEVDFFEHRYTNFALRKLLPSLMQRPDSRFPFFKKWRSVVRSLRTAPDVICSLILSSTLMAYRLASRLKFHGFCTLAIDDEYVRMSTSHNPYDDGGASQRIPEGLLSWHADGRSSPRTAQ